MRSVLDNPVYCGKLANGRRHNEKIPGTRNQYHIVKQDEYMLYDGAHEAIVSEEDWQLAHQQRQITGVRQEKTHSLEHEHILSGILKCPVCGGGMYGNVNRKKKKDGSLYRDYFDYACKHRLHIDGKRCDYHRQWGEDNVYQFLLYFDKLYDKFTDSEKKEFIKSFIEKVEIYPEKLPNGRFLKRIEFWFPVFFNGQAVDGLSWCSESTVEMVVILFPKKKIALST